MPELFSRMDNLNWLTPSIADILDQGSTPPGGDGSIRERMLIIQQELDTLDTPARIVNVRSTPSYTLYIARPESIGKTRNRRTVSANEIKQSIKQIADNHKNWLLGFMPQLRQEDTAVGILLRTDEHRPVSLRRLLVRGTFRKHPSTFAFVLGITLEQQMVVESINTIGHMLVVGSDNAKQHFIRSTLLTLIMLNTPSELRVAIAGESSDVYKYLVGAPHALGRILTTPEDGQRLIDGLIKEVQRRKQSMQDEDVITLGEYNDSVVQKGKTTLPRIVLIVDALTDQSWQSASEKWKQSLTTLLNEGISVGIHLIITVDDEDKLDISRKSLDKIKLKVITRASSKDISTNIPDFHASLLRFVDAFVIDQANEITPVELCAISNTEIKNVVEYWRHTSKQRYQEMQASKVSNQTGVTGVLTPPPELEAKEVSPPTPPTPTKPSVATLARATQKLGAELSAVIAEKKQEQSAQEETLEKSQAQELPIIEENELDETLASPTMLEQPQVSPTDEETMIKFEQAVALTAYLGWISRGALCDIFYISTNHADDIIQQLKDRNVVENASYPTLRFIKSIQPSNGRYQQD